MSIVVDLKDKAVSRFQQANQTSVGLGTVLLFAAMFGFLIWMNHQSELRHERALAKAEQREDAYRADSKVLMGQLIESEKARAELAVQQAQVKERIIYRDREADKRIDEVTQPGRETQKVLADVEGIIKPDWAEIVKGSNGSDLLAMDIPSFQRVVATQIDRDRLAANLTDTQEVLGLEQKKVASLTDDLKKSEELRTQGDTVIEGYKKAAKGNKVKRFLGDAVKIVIGVGIGSLLK
jgi:hypothetical protein